VRSEDLVQAVYLDVTWLNAGRTVLNLGMMALLNPVEKKPTDKGSRLIITHAATSIL
jgi:hypothetical protein